MLLSHTKRLFIILPSLISASPQKPTTTASSLPTSLQSSVPTCAQPCLVSALYDQFPLACASSGDLECLCSRYSTTGESLGEVALGCVYASCSSVDESAASAYNICIGQKNAVTPTQTALTVTAFQSTLSSAASTSFSSITSSEPTSAPSSTLSISGSSRTIPTESVVAASASATLSPSVSSMSSKASTDASSATQSQEPKGLKTTQIVGIAVAAVATFILAIGLMVLSICFRRRHERKKEAEFEKYETTPRQSRPRFSRAVRFSMASRNRGPSATERRRQDNGVGVAPISKSSDINSNANPSMRAYSDPYSTRPLPAINTNVQSSIGPSFGSMPPPESQGTKKHTIPLEEIGLAISPETERYVSPQSAGSTRTVSRLLPDKPVPILRAPRAPQRAETRPQRLQSVVRRPNDTMERPDSVLTTDTVFEEDAPSESRRSSRIGPPAPTIIPPFRKFKPSRPPRPHHTLVPPVQAYKEVQQPMNQPELSLDIPVLQSRSQPVQIQSASEPQHATRPVSKHMTSRPVLSNTASSSSDNLDMSSGGYIPDYYISPEKLLPRAEKLRASPERFDKPRKSPKVVQIKSKGSSSTVSRSVSRASESGRESRSSNTSFETVDPNDSTPETEDETKQLSPVVESPISNLRYPKVPRASNQAVPRSPRSPRNQKEGQNDALSPAPSLLVKRRGEKRAQELESRLWVRSPSTMSSKSNESTRRHPPANNSGGRRVKFSPEVAQQEFYYDESQWGTPTTFEMSPIRPLNYTAKNPEMEGLKSPLWVPRLTPTRQGDDLFISVV